MKILHTNDRISLGQCFNLAHNEKVKFLIHDDKFLIRRTLELFNIKKEIEARLEQ